MYAVCKMANMTEKNDSLMDKNSQEKCLAFDRYSGN